MSASRTALATAASTVDGISVVPYFRQSAKAGDGCVRLDRINYPNQWGVVTWQVLITLPSDIATAEKYLEEKTPALVDALSQEMAVASVTPQQLVLDTATVPCVVIQGTREQE